MKSSFITPLCFSILFLIPFQLPYFFVGNACAADQDSARTAAPAAVPVVYDSAVIIEDVTWRGNVLVKGIVVVAPHATLRIEAGTVVRFAPPDAKNVTARLVVQGRIQAIGTAASPILMTSVQSAASRNVWGGIFLVATEKNNILEHCRIEYADCGVDARFSSLHLRTVTITKSRIAILARDAVVNIAGGSVAESQTGIEAHDSEFTIRDATVANCQRGMVMNRTSLGLSSVTIMDNRLSGLLSDDCRVKIASGDFSGNAIGASFKGGEGQIQMTRFKKNTVTALHVQGARMKIQRCQFSDNSKDAIRLEDAMALVSGNSFSSNTGFNLHNAGREDVNAPLNWWGSTDHSVIVQKIHDAAREPRSGAVLLFPWLTEKPLLMP